MKKILLVILTVLVLFLDGYCDQSDRGTKEGQILKLGVSARAGAMGESAAACTEDAYSSFYNVAGLSFIESTKVGLMYTNSIEGIAYNYLSIAFPTKVGNFGVSGQYLSYGSIDRTDEIGDTNGSFNPNELVGALSYAKKVSNLGIGISIKYLTSKIDETSGNSIMFDLGLKYKLEKLNIGLAAQNLGSKIKHENTEEDLYSPVKAGVSYNINENLLISGDVIMPNDNELIYGAGIEENLKVLKDLNILLRGGYNTITKDVDGLQGLTAGFGLGFGRYSLDYAFMPLGELGENHKISLSVGF